MRRLAHDGILAGILTYSGCALSDVVTLFSNKPGDTAIITGLLTIALLATANRKTSRPTRTA